MHFKAYKTILSPKNGMNIYRGCTHGCIYCDSRSKCYQMDHDFEDIEVKENAPQILEDQLRRRRQLCMVGTGAMTDPYIQLEASLGYTRQCLEIIEKYGFGLAIQTKSTLILRDIDLLARIHAKAKCVVQMTLTTFDDDLCLKIEPDVAPTSARLEVLNALRDRGIPTIVWLSPLLPFINDTVANVQGILEGCIAARVHGILYFGAGLTLREGNREYFYQQLDVHFPGLKQRYMRAFGNAYECHSPNGKVLDALVREACEKHGMLYGPKACFEYLHEFTPNVKEEQLTLEDWL